MIEKQNWCNYDGDIIATEYYDTETKKRVLSDDYGKYTGGTEEDYLELAKKYWEQFNRKNDK